jgi:protein-L-isoaspartate(D-aspartate) O-methyltransferase
VPDLATHRRRFAENLREADATISDVVVDAFAAVAREQFLGPGPWHILEQADDGSTRYRVTDTANPAHVYHDILVGIDPTRA